MIIHPEELTKKQIDKLADAGIGTLGIHPRGGRQADKWLSLMLERINTPEFKALIDYAKEKGLSVEYEIHAASYLMPRSLFDTNPEYFRVNESGKRTPEWNFCVSNPEALELFAKRAASLSLSLYGSSNNFYFWMDDGRDTCCHCEKCRELSPSDQQMIAVNAMLKEIKKHIPDAKMAYLAYFEGIVPPKTVAPDKDVFLEYAPFEKYTAKGENADALIARELSMLAPLTELFGKNGAKVLEYWYDNSLFSNWTKPPKKFTLDSAAMERDVEDYRARGFNSISTFACFLGEDYEALYGDVDYNPFGNALNNTLTVSKNELDNTVPAEDQLKNIGAVRLEGSGGVRVLFIGNSITWHGVKEDIGWYGDYGMAASCQEKDYVHVLRKMIGEKRGRVSTCIAQLAEWERSYTSETVLQEKYAAAKDFSAEIIVVRIGENMPKGSAPECKPYFDAMIKYFITDDTKKVVITDSFWRNDARDTMIREIAEENGYEFCKISDLEGDPAAMAIGQYEHRGVSVHPSDFGMEQIAKRIFERLGAEYGV